MTTRHEFLAQLHELRKPETYLEIGVQHGWSLQLSHAPISIGVDPEPLITAGQLHRQTGRNFMITHDTSDIYFAEGFAEQDLNGKTVDLAFIDGMHLAEYAWRDFVNIARYCGPKSIVVFDDVLPTTQEMAAREQCPGDWTGDVWKVYQSLRDTDLVIALVDTQPTGTLVVTGFDDIGLDSFNYWLECTPQNPFEFNLPVPVEILDRRHAWSAPAVIENLMDRGFGQ